MIMHAHTHTHTHTDSPSTELVQSIYAKKWSNPKQIATVMKPIPKVVKFYVV